MKRREIDAFDRLDLTLITSAHAVATFSLFISIAHLYIIVMLSNIALSLHFGVIYSLSRCDYNFSARALFMLPGCLSLSLLFGATLYPVILIKHNIDLLNLASCKDWSSQPAYFFTSRNALFSLQKLFWNITKKRRLEVAIECLKAKSLPKEIIWMIMNKSRLPFVMDDPLLLQHLPAPDFNLKSTIQQSNFGFLAPDYLLVLKSFRRSPCLSHSRIEVPRDLDNILCVNIELFYLSFFVCAYVSLMSLVWLM